MKVILYHDNCMDGLGARYAAHTAIPEGQAIYLPVNYDKPVPLEAFGKDKEVFILDFSYPREALLSLNREVKSLLVLDHHKTAADDLAGLEFAKFDMNKSGAVLAWEHFHPDEPVPALLRHVQDRDLWQWKLENTKAVYNYLELLDGDMAAWEGTQIVSESPDGMDYISEAGGIIQDYKRLQIKRSLPHVQIVEWPREDPVLGRKWILGLVNTTGSTSEIGSDFVQAHPEADFFLGYNINHKEGTVGMSFRSTDKFDCSRVAKLFGGGGHPKASGASMTVREAMEVGLFTLTPVTKT